MMDKTAYGRIRTKTIVLIGVFAALLAVVSQISLPMPSGVPVTLQVFAVAFIGVVLGERLGPAAVLIYMLIGAVGAPVFANFRGGLSVFAGASGGYIMAWPVMAFLCGLWKEAHTKSDLMVNIILALFGLAIVECFGGFWWALITGGDMHSIMLISLTAFIPKDILITVIGVVIGRQVRRSAGNILN